nr:MAG TPA: replication regulatory protein [Caudoviricetes sp.]
MAEKSRAEYFRERRKAMKQLVFMVDKEKAEALDRKLAENGEGRTEWFRKKLEEEIGK